ncbi:unnamed protein product [Rhizophagus irregularis]|nr:unnamed protein product [Rhizophagus irregularis]
METPGTVLGALGNVKECSWGLWETPGNGLEISGNVKETFLGALGNTRERSLGASRIFWGLWGIDMVDAVSLVEE